MRYPVHAAPSSVVALFVKEGVFGTKLVCATTRRNKPEDLSLPGGKVEPGEDPVAALLREIREELGKHLRIFALRFVYERTDPADHDSIAWVFEITSWIGEPQQSEEGIGVSWTNPHRLLQDNCTFREYNRGLFLHTNLIPWA